MCLIAMAWGVSAEYPLVIASNRDEYYARPTAPLAPWCTDDGHTIYSGRDLRDGGTWLGFAHSGRFAMLTNVRNGAVPVPPAPRSRGALVTDWLTSQLGAQAWSQAINPGTYAGFNLIVGDWARQECHYLSNQDLADPASDASQYMPPDQWNIAQAATHSIANGWPQPIQRGQIVGLSNAALNTPWPKTRHLVDALGAALGEPLGHVCGGKPFNTLGRPAPERLPLAGLQAALQRTLLDEHRAPTDQLPRTGVPAALEQALSSVFVRYPAEQPSYGTRTSLVAVLSAGQRLHLLETTHATSHQGGGQVAQSIDWPL